MGGCPSKGNPNSAWPPFCPNIGAAGFFLALFTLTTCAHLVQSVVHRKGYSWVIVMSGLWQTLAYTFRIISIKNYTSDGMYSAWFVLILLAPLWTNAFIYMVVGRMVYNFTASARIFSIPAWRFGLYFVLLDVLAFLVQATGASMASGSNLSNSQIFRGLHIYMTGIGMQLLFLLCFLAICFKARQQISRDNPASGTSRPFLLLNTVFAVIVLITIRIVFRLVEYSNGYSHGIPIHEAYQYCLDSLPMFIALVLLNVVHPGRIMPGKECDLPSRKSRKALGKKNVKGRAADSRTLPMYEQQYTTGIKGSNGGARITVDDVPSTASRKSNASSKVCEYQQVPTRPSGASLPHITIIRPVKGIEPHLYECLASTFEQTYAPERVTVYLCISDDNDPALPILQQLLADFPGFDAKIFIQDEDPELEHDSGSAAAILGPNPKIRNMSRAYREAKGDILWIVDCNVWVGPSVGQQMVDLLCGFGKEHGATRTKYKFVHQLPLSVALPSKNKSASFREKITGSGGLLEETFLSTSHAKFYTAINAVAVAPCIVGKSNMFRRSHLNALTSTTTAMNPNPKTTEGIDHFSFNICEDHLLASLLWESPVPASIVDLARCEGSESTESTDQQDFKWRHHAMLPPTSPENLAIQPMINYSLGTYIDRRVRWLRVRKFTVTIATLVEPGTESFLCSAYAAFAVTTIPYFNQSWGIPSTWAAFISFWLISVTAWACLDRWVWRMLHTNDLGSGPAFSSDRTQSRPWSAWALGWIGREFLALPIWTWAIFGGVTVVWRGRKFWVGMDMRVHEMESTYKEDSGRLQRDFDGINSGDTGSGGESGRKSRRD